MISLKNLKKYARRYLKDPLLLHKWEDVWHAQKYDNQISVKIVNREKSWQYSYNGVSHMFAEDMYAGIMPFMMYKGEKEKYPIYIEPRDAVKEEIIAKGISGNRGYLEDALCDFVRHTTQVLFQTGEVLYELVYKKNEKDEVEEFGLTYLSTCCLYEFLGNYYQIIPWWIAKKSKIKVGINKIPKNKVLRINFPKELGGKRGFKKIIKRLWYLGKQVVPEFYINSMKYYEDNGFDLNKYTNLKYLEIAKLTKEIGWNQRQLSNGYITEYYSMVRYIRNKKAKTIIRDKIIGDLNAYLNGNLLNLGVKIIYENFSKIQEIEEQEARLKYGNVEFMDILNKTNF